MVFDVRTSWRRSGAVGQYFVQVDGPAELDAAVGGHAHGDGPEAVLERHLRRPSVADGGQEVEVLEVARPVVQADVGDGVVVDRVGLDAPDPVLAAPPDAHRALGQQRLDLAGVTDDGQLFLVVRGLGEHAQIEQRTGAARVVHDHEGVVEHVGGVALDDLVEVVDVLGTGRHDPPRSLAEDQVHQVEEVARLLDQRPARVGRQPVPLVDLGQEREPVLPHRHHARGAHGVRADQPDELGRGRHVAVLQPDPRDCARRPAGAPAR